MKSIEIEGKTIDEAIENACKEFQVPREKLNIEIISEGTSGLFGIVGTKKAKIKASLMTIDIALNSDFYQPQGQAQTILSNEQAVEVRLSDKGDDTGESVAMRAKRILEGLLDRMDLNFPVTVEETEEAIILNIQGDGGGLLIGRRGQNLDAVQYIINKASNKSVNGRKVIIVDVENYRKKRETSLTALAGKLGEKVKKTKKIVTVDHMNARDRRIIHLTLQNDESLITKSRGEGEYKKIIIMPSKKR